MRPDPSPRYTLSEDGMTLVIKRRVQGGILVATLQRQPGAGPYTAACPVHLYPVASKCAQVDGSGTPPAREAITTREDTQ